MIYAVTAVSGQLGRQIATKLADQLGKARVVGLARTPEHAKSLGIEIRPGDYDEPGDLRTSLQGIDALVLVSGMAPPEDRVGQHRNVIEAAKAAGVRKIVYTSIQGPDEGTGFSQVVQSNRQTEADIRAWGSDWAIGRNGIYIEPDVEYIDSYRAKGEIANSAADGRCGYTTRSELGHAYTALLTRDDLKGRTVDLNGTPITQEQLTVYLNDAFGTDLTIERCRQRISSRIAPLNWANSSVRSSAVSTRASASARMTGLAISNPSRADLTRVGTSFSGPFHISRGRNAALPRGTAEPSEPNPMKNIKIALWGIPALLTVLWVAATLPFPDPLNFLTIRNLLVQYSGVIATAVMSVGMILALRLSWLEGWLHGLDKSYRLHKWLGIMALVVSVAHWVASELPKWMVSLGLLSPPERGAPPGGLPGIGPIQAFFNSQRGTAEVLGEWSFYAAVVLIALALIKRFPYKYFVSTHKLISGAYLAVVAHSVPLLTFDDWLTPIGILSALLMVGGTVAAVLSLTGLIGRGNTVAGRIDTVRTFPDIRATAIDLTLNDGWKDHDAGQFAFVTFDRREGKHPFTIASAWDPETREIMFITKALGDYTDFLPETLESGGEATVEGPYGRFTFDDARERQIWIGGGIGITPFVARMKQLAKIPGEKAVSLIHSTRELSEDAIALLTADATAAGVDLHVLVDDADGYLTGDRLRDMIPDWKSASVWFCGPAGFGQALHDDLVAHGLAHGDFHQELFNIR